jgi:glycerol-3-phosphate dehydrogenase (NAD(P)+)
MNKIITVLGAGAWGTAISSLLAENGFDVVLWCYEGDVANDIANNHVNSAFFSEVKLSTKIRSTSDLQVAFQSSEFVFEAIPVKHMRSILDLAKGYVTKNHKFIVTSKGLEQGTCMLPGQIVQDIFGIDILIACVGGPNFAKDLIAKKLTGSVVASICVDLGDKVASMLSNNYFKSYISDDIIGVQVGGAVKNIFAITIGMANGLGYTQNTIAFLITRCMFELVTLGKYFGGNQSTFYGLSGFGDLFLTCSSAVSKNFKIGKLLAEGFGLDEISSKYAAVPEGINTIKTVKQIIDHQGLNLPICQGIHDVVFEGLAFKLLLDRIVSSPATGELN